MIAPKSAIEAAAMISCPNVDEISPASLSTGTSTPSEVAHRMIATSSGVSTRPAALSPSATTTAIPNERAKPSAASRSDPAAQLVELDLEARQEQHEREPDQRDDLDRLIDLDEPEHRRPDDDARRDLQHHARQLQPREQAEDERRGERDRDDEQQVAEGGHAPVVARGAAPLRHRRPSPASARPLRALTFGSMPDQRAAISAASTGGENR